MIEQVDDRPADLPVAEDQPATSSSPTDPGPSDPDPQPTAGQTALYCLVRIAQHHGIDLKADRLLHDYALDNREPDLRLLARIATEAGFKAKAVRLRRHDLIRLNEAFPAIARLRNGNLVILSGLRPRPDQPSQAEPDIVVLDPLADRHDFMFLPWERFEEKWTGEVLLIKRHYRLQDEDQPFGLRWFFSRIQRQKGVLRDVALAAMGLHALALVVPLFFQIVIDKVLIHEGLTTLQIVGIGVIVALLFDGLLTFLRSFVLLHGTAKVDIRIATHTFKHLTSLPITFFEKISNGVLTKHMQQASSIREFLTGHLFMTLLDASVLFVFLPILFFYSVKLTILVLGFTLTLAGIIFVVAGIFRRRLYELYRAEAQRQALLVETIHGMATIKSLALEPRQRRDWDQQSAYALERHIAVGSIAAVANSISDVINKLMNIAIIWIGALLVFDADITVGALVAFNMIAMRVSGPLVQMVTLIQHYQQVALSLQMLGEVMRQPSERGMGRGLQAPIGGQIAFENVHFTYPGATAPALREVSIALPRGAVVGIVGRSGSGKTTFAKLIQGLHTPQGGLVRVDGIDLREWDKAHLRRQIGVVLQENFMFRGTVTDNIKVTKPNATAEDVVVVARIAGAHEFIEQLPQGYDTLLEEGASNLSGGQKQRLAIARALLRDPPILIFDEATSALDPDSEAAIQANLRRITHGRTTVIISHRLAMVRHADLIIVLEKGGISASGRHATLIRTSPIYSRLWQQQAEPYR